MDQKSYEYCSLNEKRHSPRCLYVAVTALSIAVVVVLSLCAYQMTVINEIVPKIKTLEDDNVVLKHNLKQLKLTTLNSVAAVDSKTQDSIIALKSETEIAITRIFSYVDTNVQNIVDVCKKEVEKAENDVMEFVNESLQNISEQVDLNERAVENISLHMMREVENVTNLIEVKIQQIVQTMSVIQSKIVSLGSQVHHPVTAYNNCEVEIRNSTCNSTMDGDKATDLCSTHPSPLEVEVNAHLTIKFRHVRVHCIVGFSYTYSKCIILCDREFLQNASISTLFFLGVTCRDLIFSTTTVLVERMVWRVSNHLPSSTMVATFGASVNELKLMLLDLVTQ